MYDIGESYRHLEWRIASGVVIYRGFKFSSITGAGNIRSYIFITYFSFHIIISAILAD